MYDDGASDSETAYASPRARVDTSDDERDGHGFDSTIRSSRRMAPEDGARRRGEPPVEVTMTRTREGNASRGMIRPSRAMAIDVATLRHVFERIDANGDGDIDPNEFLEAWSDDPEIGQLLTVGCDIACSTESIDDAEKLRRAQKIFDAIDADRNARVTFREFKKYFELRAKTPVRVENSPTKGTALNLSAPLEFTIFTLKRAFDVMDADGDGEISPAELSRGWMSENIGDLLGNTWLEHNKKASPSDVERMSLHIQNIFLRIEADRHETAGISFPEFVRYFQVKDTSRPTDGALGERTDAKTHSVEKSVSRPCCLAFCTSSASAQAAMRYAESIKMPQPLCCFFCCVW